MNQKQLLLLGEQELKKCKIEEAHIKAKRLLSYVLKQNSQNLIINALEEVSPEKQLEYEKSLQEIIEGKPIQYIIHYQEFMGLKFYVNENVIIPQPDTEILVETTIELIQKQLEQKEKINILDLCTGSGCIGISLAKYLENVQVTLSDISTKALEIAKKNVISNKVIDSTEIVCSDLFEEIKGRKFHYIVSNPPYIETNTIETLSLEVKHEPYIALDGGKDGLCFYREILKQVPEYLKENGYLLLEIGYNQAEKIIEIWSKEQRKRLDLITTKAIQDLGGNDRVLIFQKSR